MVQEDGQMERQPWKLALKIQDSERDSTVGVVPSASRFALYKAEREETQTPHTHSSRLSNTTLSLFSINMQVVSPY